jgi:hypothetical protein
MQVRSPLSCQAQRRPHLEQRWLPGSVRLVAYLPLPSDPPLPAPPDSPPLAALPRVTGPPGVFGVTVGEPAPGAGVPTPGADG